jgi:hypothetical protein
VFLDNQEAFFDLVVPKASETVLDLGDIDCPVK